MEVKNGCISNSSYLSNIAIFHFHDGRKSTYQRIWVHFLDKLELNGCYWLIEVPSLKLT